MGIFGCKYFGTRFCDSQTPNCKSAHPQNYYGLGKDAGCFRTASAKEEKERNFLRELERALKN